jgi:hypothetical protein
VICQQAKWFRFSIDQTNKFRNKCIATDFEFNWETKKKHSHAFTAMSKRSAMHKTQKSSTSLLDKIALLLRVTEMFAQKVQDEKNPELKLFSMHFCRSHGSCVHLVGLRNYEHAGADCQIDKRTSTEEASMMV